MELQKGDRVKLTDRALASGDYREFPSRYGTVYGPGYGVSVDVIWDGFNDGHSGGNECGRGRDPSNDIGHWYVSEGDMLLVKAAKRPRPSVPTIVADLKLKPQSKTILLHLKGQDHISPAQALIVYGISRLAACVHDIRNAGYKVSMKMKQDAQGHKYAQYALVK